jgi:hydrogenase maturation protease
MKLARIKDIANAVLYEGYILYPYRPSSIKNRQRWTFGCVFPQAYGGRQGDASTMQTQTLLRANAATTIGVQVRFLQVLTREIAALRHPMDGASEVSETDATLVARLEVDGNEFLAWEEAIEREVVIADLSISQIADQARPVPFAFESTRSREPIGNSKGQTVGLFIRSGRALQGIVEISATRLTPDVYRVTVRVNNVTPLSAGECAERSLAQRCAFASTHTILDTTDGAFVSLMDPPEALRQAAAACDNQSTWPVLVGQHGDVDAVLSSPIILYDYPQLAPESAGDLFDATEIDEILTLRILAMTDAEKREMASADVRARALLERTHGLTAAELAQMHGVMRPAGSIRHADDSLSGRADGDSKPRLASLLSRGRNLSVGTEVLLRPKAGGDIMDLALAGKVAIIEAIERDFEDRVHIAVTLRDDPGRDLGTAGFPGHRFYFSQDEIEPTAEGDRS